jgi:hypothetical protein
VATLVADALREMGCEVGLTHRDLPPAAEAPAPVEEKP